MVKIGIIGGIGPESTIQYYRLLTRRYQEMLMTENLPDILINSVNMSRMLNLIIERQYGELIDFLSEEIKLLEDCGVKIAALSSGTPHIVFEELQERSKIRLISVVEATCALLNEKKVKRAGLIGTKLMMAPGLYDYEAEKYDIEVITPDEKSQNFIQERYLGELMYGKVNPDTKSRFIEIINQMKEQSDIEGIILGGTELPAILSQDDFKELGVYDTTWIHVDSILRAAIREGKCKG